MALGNFQFMNSTFKAVCYMFGSSIPLVLFISWKQRKDTYPRPPYMPMLADHVKESIVRSQEYVALLERQAAEASVE
ncbi:MAG: hypothetical protein MHM6MM_000341 [Cercozoa sp. M6MM]